MRTVRSQSSLRPLVALTAALVIAGFMLTPTVRRTLAPRGKTPIIKSWDRHDRISAISCIAVSPKRRRLGLYFQLLPDKENVHGEEVVAFLKQLKQHLRRVTLIWDRSQIHGRSRVVKKFLKANPAVVADAFAVWREQIAAAYGARPSEVASRPSAMSCAHRSN